jgi:hypothetical protein
VCAQELVGRRELGPDPRRLAAGALGGGLGVTALRAWRVARALGLGQRVAALRGRLRQAGRLRRGGLARGAQLASSRSSSAARSAARRSSSASSA